MTFSAPKVSLCVLGLLGALAPACAQNQPAVKGPTSFQGFSLPTAGDLSYGLTASESARFGYNSSTVYSTSFSGDVAYASASTTNPFSATYSAGYIFSSGYGSNNGPQNFFQTLSLSQGFHLGRWQFSLNDSLSYLPDAPSGGFSGVPGLGDVGVTPPGTQQTLTNYSARISNSAAISVNRALTGRTSLGLSGSYNLMRFTGANTNGAYSNDSLSGSASVSHSLSALSNVSLSYSQSHSTYPDSTVFYSFTTQSLLIGYSSALSRQTTYSLSAGPQRSSSGSGANAISTYSTSFSGNISHSLERGSFSLSASRSANAGYGVSQGSVGTNASLSYGMPLSRVSSVSASASYGHNTSLFSSLTGITSKSDTFTASLQGARSIGQYLSAYASYNLSAQWTSGLTGNNAAFQGVSHGISGGISYSPRPIHLGHQ